MEINQQGKYEFSHEELLQIWESNDRKDDSILNYIYEKINRDTLKEDKNKEIKKKVVNFCSFIRKHLPNCNRLLSRFKEKHSEWLASKMILVVENKDCKRASASKLGRPHLNYDEAGQRLKRKLAFELSTEREHNTQLLVHAAAVSAKKSSKGDTAYVLKECSSSSSRASESCLGENAAEARNKFYKKDRNAHARKSSRAYNLSDVFHRAMDSSDPLISSLHLNKRENKQVVALLEAPEIAITAEAPIDKDEDRLSDDDEMADLDMFNDYSIDLDVNEDLE